MERKQVVATKDSSGVKQATMGKKNLKPKFAAAGVKVTREKRSRPKSDER